MSVPSKVLELVERFERNLEPYKQGKYNETQVRLEFINPLFEELGWDIANIQGYAEAYKDVVHEDAIKVGGATKAPDYSFRIGGIRKFFLEAKKPSVDIRYDIHPAYQLRRYAWSAKLPLSILTDFEEFAVYDCRVKPVKTDKASHSRILYLTYTGYTKRWEEIADIFSRQAILKGSFDKYVESKKTKRGTAEVDAAFLQEIERWRDLLARNIALRNPGLTQRELNFAVQRTIDRIIFLRICEDRGIEFYGKLMALQNGARIYQRLFQLFRQADDRYNSGLFHFRHEKERPDYSLDKLTPDLSIDDKVVKDILKNLYYPDSPYEFSVLPADILGQVYEQFLGKVIRLTPAHHAVVDDKPEVRKAGGVYYTPTYIVDYIVKQTVGKVVEGKKPGPRGAVSKLKILDPACGSGSFLLGAYQFLLDWHRDEYIKDGPEKWATGRTPRLHQTDTGEWKLTTDERKRILLNNIYGVDIDPQAVEVTKLSLLLKVLEGEDEQTIAQQFALFRARVLPDLGNNIKCGNSLIGPDFYDGQQMSLLNKEEIYRINAFDWQTEFPEIMNPPNPPLEKGGKGGFDAVIGNPPYGAFFGGEEKVYIKQKYNAYKYRYDSYIYFIEKAIALTRENGIISFITPEVWLRLENCAPLRKLISEHTGFEKVRVFGENVFLNAVVNTIVFVFRRSGFTDYLTIEIQDDSWQIPSQTWMNTELLSIEYRLKPETQILMEKISQQSTRLSSLGEVIQGLTPYDRYQGQDIKLIKKRAYHFKFKKDDTCGKWLFGKDVNRYNQTWSGEWLSYGPWLAAPREKRFFEGERLLFREVPGKHKRMQATLVGETLYYGHSITPFKIRSNLTISLKYILGIVNSKLLSLYGGFMLPNFGKETFPKLNPQDIKQLPTRTIDFSDPNDEAYHDQMVVLVERMLDLHKQLAEVKEPQAKTVLQRQIETTDRQIDELVYELYGLTEEEIKIVEGSAG